VADFKIVEGMNEGLDAALEIGYPLALKTASPHVLHKTEKAAVLLHIKDKEALEGAFHNMKTDSYLLQKMAPSGCEIIIGGRNDPEFGPIILCGLGGIFVEVYKDVAVRVTPINEEAARQMIGELRGAVILKGFRGQQPYDEEYLVATLVNISRLLVEHPEINVLDINPLILMGKGNGGIVVDVKLQVV
jgi:hypothetical protein